MPIFPVIRAVIMKIKSYYWHIIWSMCLKLIYLWQSTLTGHMAVRSIA